jgi:hypothetical protein
MIRARFLAVLAALIVALVAVGLVFAMVSPSNAEPTEPGPPAVHLGDGCYYDQPGKSHQHCDEWRKAGSTLPIPNRVGSGQ